MDFQLDEVLEKDSHYLGKLQLCQARLVDNRNYPWIILIPMKPAITEITDLTDEDYTTLSSEIREITRLLQKEFGPDKLNIGIIGNMVRQLHVHIVARFKNDNLFPKTVWGSELLRYDDKTLETTIELLRHKMV